MTTLQLIAGLALIVAWLPFAVSCIAHHSPKRLQVLSVAAIMAGGALCIDALTGQIHPCATLAAFGLSAALLICRSEVRHSLEASTWGH